MTRGRSLLDEADTCARCGRDFAPIVDGTDFCEWCFEDVFADLEEQFADHEDEFAEDEP